MWENKRSTGRLSKSSLEKKNEIKFACSEEGREHRRLHRRRQSGTSAVWAFRRVTGPLPDSGGAVEFKQVPTATLVMYHSLLYPANFLEPGIHLAI